MITFKCKMCGGDLHPEENATTCECEYCGSVQTIPTADNEKKGNLFNRANRLRMAAEYDKAAAVYASITAEFPEEAEAYWGLCLCKYGIEYVEDPATAKKIPTCHRTRTESIMDDPDFDQACENADAVAKKVYREEAKAIDRLQQDILSVVASESPYDVFICYKETDEEGQRTEDSVLAEDIYDALTGKGLKVFFARITLEDKLGQQYEPYIYAALHSAKVMLAIGTQYEYYDAVWVKNEWARFLDMMKGDKGKAIIPCYKDIDAYDMPREFKNLQAQDMGKLGWLQDLTRGVLKLCGKDEQKPQAAPVVQQVVQTGGATVDNLLRRAFVFLEDGDWNSAEEYAEKVLDIEVENGRAYLVKLMAALNVRFEKDLKDLEEPYDGNENYQKIIRFGDDALRAQVQGDIAYIKDRNEHLILRQSEARKKVEEIRKAAEEKAKAAHTAAETYEADLQAYELAEQKYIAVNEALKEAQQDYKSAQSGIASLQTELAGLHGLFSGRRKRELEEQIKRETRELQSNQARIQSLMEQCERATAERRERPVMPVAEIDAPDLPDDREVAYQCAKIYAEVRLYDDAGREYNKIRGYKDVDNIIENNDNMAASVWRAHFETGNTVTYGQYEQDNDTANSKEAIEWIVLANDGETVTLISKYGLDVKPYSTTFTGVTWDSCILRKWLNGEFLNAAFSEEERAKLETVMVKADKNPDYSTNPGKATQDKVFLLSIAEANALYSSNDGRKCQATAYAKAQGASMNVDGNSWWWLRSPGGTGSRASYVYAGGSVDMYGRDVTRDGGVVRPVVVLRLK